MSKEKYEEDSLEKLNKDKFERYYSEELEKEATEVINRIKQESSGEIESPFGLSDEFFKNCYKSSVIKMEFKEREERLLNKIVERSKKVAEEEREKERIRLKEEKERIKEEFKRNRKNKK